MGGGEVDGGSDGAILVYRALVKQSITARDPSWRRSEGGRGRGGLGKGEGQGKKVISHKQELC